MYNYKRKVCTKCIPNPTCALIGMNCIVVLHNYILVSVSIISVCACMLGKPFFTTDFTKLWHVKTFSFQMLDVHHSIYKQQRLSLHSFLMAWHLFKNCGEEDSQNDAKGMQTKMLMFFGGNVLHLKGG